MKTSENIFSFIFTFFQRISLFIITKFSQSFDSKIQNSRRFLEYFGENGSSLPRYVPLVFCSKIKIMLFIIYQINDFTFNHCVRIGDFIAFYKLYFRKYLITLIQTFSYLIRCRVSQIILSRTLIMKCGIS